MPSLFFKEMKKVAVIHDGNGNAIDRNNPLQTELQNVPIMPYDKQAQLKTQIESNTTPLGANATYTGAGFDTMADGINFTWLTGIVYANQSGSLQIQQSLDGTTWDVIDGITCNAGTAYKISVDVVSRHVRFVYVNGATAQTTFRLHAFATFKG